ncbi:proton pump-interactor 1-like isoform X2 [Papaver somniferum]|uniref:proton pump-interactor 1-like isoform X2 n=1 Tax=Papaver somniferum TaxID=3469 RepID=UPI000E6FF262|nr:proton pump-interactor 1-like isoform X2 [Papaver somniferum]
MKLHTEMCTTREKNTELNCHIRSLHSRMQHGKNTLVEEKHLLREIKQLEGTRDAFIASGSKKKDFDKRRNNVYEAFKFGWDQNFRNQVECVGVEDLGVVKKQKHLTSQRIQPLKELVKRINNEISLLQVKLTATEQKKNSLYEHLFELKIQWENEEYQKYSKWA